MFDTVERAVGGRLEQTVRTERFADVVAAATKLEGRTRTQVERLTREALHLVNLPAASDVKRVDDHLARVERRLRDIAKQVDELGGGK